jgi:hypothetical protein
MEGGMQPLILFRKNGLYMKLIPDKGRGVFCNEFIAADEVIEVAPVYIFREQDIEHIRATDLVNYWFRAGDGFSQHVYLWSNIKDGSKVSCLPMGITSFCNHLIDPNASWKHMEDRSMPFFTLTASRDIPPDTEICISYGVSWFAKHKESIKRSSK